MLRQPDEWYEYRPKGRCWVVYFMKRDATGSTGKHIGTVSYTHLTLPTT